MVIKSCRLRAVALTFVMSLACAQASPVENVLSQPAASQAQFPSIPLRRDAPDESPTASAGWAALLLVIVAGVGFALYRKGAIAGLRPRAANAAPKVLGRTVLTSQASLHLVEWKGEELLLACTPQSVAVLARQPASTTASGKAAAANGENT